MILVIIQLKYQTLISTDITVIIFRPSIGHAFAEFEISEVVNKILDYDIMRQCHLGDDSDFDDDYTQLVTPGMHTTSNSDNINDGDR
jgi:hypothetical protein